MPRPDDALVDVVRRLSSVPLWGRTTGSVLTALADAAAPVLGARPSVSVTVVGDGPPRTAASSGSPAHQLDGVQYREDAGPCLHAARTGRPAGTTGSADPRWPVFARALTRAGCDSAWSQPLPLPSPVSGSLNLYLPAGVAPDRRATAGALIAGAALPVADTWVYETAVRTGANLRLALESRGVIEQAKGILMERLKITADDAFDALARVSNDTNTKLRDVAQGVVDTGSLPPDPGTRRSPAPR